MVKIAIIAGYAKSLINFRGELIREFIKLGHQVIAMAPESGFERELNSIGAQYRSIPLQRNGLNVFKDLCTLLSLLKILREEKPDIVFLYTVKPVIYGSLAAQMAKIPYVYSMITGLGYPFTGATLKQRMLAKLLRFLYKLSLKNNKKVFFQNPDDLRLFKELNLLTGGNKAVLINGSGVDVRKFAYETAKVNPLSFLLMARLLWDKGIAEYVEAARMLKQRYPDVRFKILGPFDSNPAGINPEDVESWVAEGVIEYLGETDDVRPYIADTSVFVLPSFYREGTPRSVLEAMSMGRPIITTDAPGCRETVQEGVNGFLVPVKDSRALAAAMEFFILNPEMISIMGTKSREIAIEKYDVHKVNRIIIETMGRGGPRKWDHCLR